LPADLAVPGGNALIQSEKTNPHYGSDFDDFLAGEDMLQRSVAIAVERVRAWHIEQETKSTFNNDE
jgi:hypothetical protein